MCRISSLIAEVARGTVFVDSNENGLLDLGEIGVSDVRVSNGTQIVLSGADGRYEIAIDDEAILFITSPKTTDSSEWAYAAAILYIHQPKGSPPVFAIREYHRQVHYQRK